MSLQTLISNGRNVAITHELFARMRLTPTFYDNLRQFGYTLIMDEEVKIIEPVNVTKQDVQMLFSQGMIKADDNGQIRWMDKNYQGRFSFLQRMAESKTLVWFQGVLFLWVFPVDILRAFTDIFVLTFLFEGSHLRSFLELNELPFDMYHIVEHQLIGGNQNLTGSKTEIKKLLHVYKGT